MNIELNNTDLIKKVVNTASPEGRAVQVSHVAVDI
jgi:hypothetical protein